MHNYIGIGIIVQICVYVFVGMRVCINVWYAPTTYIIYIYIYIGAQTCLYKYNYIISSDIVKKCKCLSRLNHTKSESNNMFLYMYYYLYYTDRCIYV